MIPDFPPEMPAMARSHVQWVLGRWGDPNGAFDDPGFRQHCSEVCAERAPVSMHRISPLMAPFTFLNWFMDLEPPRLWHVRISGLGRGASQAVRLLTDTIFRGE